jgi:hypothetical protein
MPESSRTSSRHIAAIVFTLALGLGFAAAGCSEQTPKASEPQAGAGAGTGAGPAAGAAAGSGGSYEGFIDEVSCQVVRGWAWNPAQPDAAVTIELYDGDRLVNTVAADKFRPDLRDGGKGNGRHVFHEATPAALKDGKMHEVRAVIKGTSLALKPAAGITASLTCAPAGT